MANAVHVKSDYSLAAWDPNYNAAVPETDCVVRTFSGHVNERNFVGLSACGDLIACGSESNEVGEDAKTTNYCDL
jgi:hypothetical protein